MPHPLRTSETDALTAVFGPAETATLWVVLGISLGALVFADCLVREVLAAPEGTDKMKEIATAIQEGAKAYLRRQFRTLAVFIVVLAGRAVLRAAGAAGRASHSELVDPVRPLDRVHPRRRRSRALTGYAGMWLAVRANVRTAQRRPESGLRTALTLAFRAGGVAGMFTVGLGLFGATVDPDDLQGRTPRPCWSGFGFGGALLAMFMRVGGGIFTKAADVGADLVGKVEQGIPEDDPRNAATIADNVGDNVGDCAGMAADLFESYEVTLVAALILGAAALAGSPSGAIVGVMFPLFVRAVGVITSIIGILAVTPRSEDEHGMKAINRGFFLSAVDLGGRRRS